MSSPSPTGKQALTGAARRQMAVELRLEGLSYREIAARMGISVKNAYKHVTKALAETREKTAESADQVRDIEIERIESLIQGLWEYRKDNRVVDTILRAMDRKAKLLGLDAPVKIDPSLAAGMMTDAERAERIAALLDAAAARRVGSAAGTLVRVESLPRPADRSLP